MVEERPSPVRGVPSRLHRALAIAVLAGGVLLVLWIFLGPVREWTNHNDGFIAAIGVFVVIPFAIWTSRLLDFKRRKELSHVTLNLLITELWHNLNYVGQIERSYENNFALFLSDTAKGIHIPHFGPRLSVLEKFITVEHLASLGAEQQRVVLEIYAQLCIVQEEFQRWRDMAIQNRIFETRELYEVASSTLLSAVDPVMRNMMDMWVRLLASQAFVPVTQQIASAALLIRTKISEGRIVYPTCKSSRYKTQRDFGPKDLIACWVDDWPDCPTERLVLCDVAAPFESWHRSPGPASKPENSGLR